MIQSLNSGLAGLEAFQNQMAVIGNNISNSNTVGFKSSRTDFADALTQSLSSGSGTIGGGVSTDEVQTMFAQGQLSQTNVPGDLAISGQGFFLVKDPVSGATYATRDGEFSTDSSGFLVNNSGQRVQGFTTAGSTSTVGDLKIAPPTGSTASVSSYNIAANGTITVTLSDGTTSTSGQVAMQNYSNPQALTSQGNNLFSGLAAAGPTSANPVAPGSSGLGSVQSGYVEMSNVDLASEMSSLITAQRGFEANAKIVTTSDEVLQAVIGLKR